MVISEQQIMHLMAIAHDYRNKLELMIDKGIANGDPLGVVNYIQNILFNIRMQQSEELKEIE